jgi:hypothetical protein
MPHQDWPYGKMPSPFALMRAVKESGDDGNREVIAAHARR